MSSISVYALFAFLALISVCKAQTCVGNACTLPMPIRPELKLCGFVHAPERHAHCFSQRCENCLTCEDQQTCQNLTECEFVSPCQEYSLEDQPKVGSRCAVKSTRFNQYFKQFTHCDMSVPCNPKFLGSCDPDFTCVPATECDYGSNCKAVRNPYFDPKRQ